MDIYTYVLKETTYSTAQLNLCIAHVYSTTDPHIHSKTHKYSTYISE